MSYFKKKLELPVRLTSYNSCMFRNYFDNKPLADDYTWATIEKICKRHLEKTKVLDFKYPHSNGILYFKGDNYTCTNKHNVACLIEDLFDLNVILSVCVSEYDFTSGDKRLVGVSLRVTHIKEVEK